MTKAPIDLQELRRRIFRKAKSEKEHRFWGIFVHVTKLEVLEEAYCIFRLIPATHSGAIRPPIPIHSGH